jgi:alkaline phosphatase D
MDVQNLSVGPIIGHTSSTLVRIFGRAELTIDAGRPRKAHGVIRYRKVGSAGFSDPIYFKMNPNFDLTGVIVVNGLEENSVYQYQMGWVYSDVDSADIDVKKVLDWKQVDTADFRTGVTNISAQRTLVFGSCRYVMRLFGGMWWDDRSDKVFKSILQQIDSGQQIHQLIMCGDQIYADDLNALGADNALDEYNKRYQKVLTTPHLRKLMSRVPTYMTLDDHEIEDNWPESASKRDWVTKFPSAIHAYATYQASHSPLFELRDHRISGSPTHLWYSYTDGCCDFFVCDCRTERSFKEQQREIIGPRQMEELINWLSNGNGMVKIIITSVPFYESDSSDKWHGYIAQRDQVIECIRLNKIQKVVFLSGDVHACMASQLKLTDDLQITSIVSSAFFWPYPHPNRKGFILDGNIETATGHQFTVVNSSAVYPTDAFTKLSVTPEQIEVEFFSRKGQKLGAKSFKLL